MRTPESETLDWYTRHSRRRLLVSSQSCACVCAGTHEGYIQVREFDTLRLHAGLELLLILLNSVSRSTLRREC